jgi:hypothetical protein
VISGSGQDVLINQNGIRLRQSLEGGGYSDEQVWMNNGTIAFTRDNWDTASLALGKVATTSGSAYGLIADVICGRLLAGNELVIENEGGTFSVDGAGATLTNANFTLNTTNGKTRIFLDPDNGIKIQGNDGGTWVDKMYADSSGNLNITGNLELGGGNYIRTSGYAKLGALTITPTTASFTGTISASKLDGVVDWSQISNIPAYRISSGTMTNVNSSGTTGAISVTGNWLDISATGLMMLRSGSSGIGINSETDNNVVLSENSYLGTANENGQLADHEWVRSQIPSLSGYATTTWVNSNFYSSGESPYFGSVYASRYYSNYGTGTYYGLSYYSGACNNIVVRGGIVTAVY